MKRMIVLSVVAIILSLAIASFAKDDGPGKSGEALFEEHCSMCHPQGGNAMNPRKTLHKSDMKANGVLKPEDVMKRMRNPGPGMIRFTPAMVPDADARKIAEYILKAFN